MVLPCIFVHFWNTDTRYLRVQIFIFPKYQHKRPSDPCLANWGEMTVEKWYKRVPLWFSKIRRSGIYLYKTQMNSQKSANTTKKENYSQFSCTSIYLFLMGRYFYIFASLVRWINKTTAFSEIIIARFLKESIQWEEKTSKLLFSIIFAKCYIVGNIWI